MNSKSTSMPTLRRTTITQAHTTLALALLALLAGCSREPADWQAAETTNTAAGYQAYLAAHGNGAHAQEAQARREDLELPMVEGPLSVQMLDGGVSATGQSVGRNIFTIDSQGTIYQLLNGDATKFTNLKVTPDYVAWQLGRRYRVRGAVVASLPKEFAGMPQVQPIEKPLKFIVSREVILLDP